MLPGWFLNRLRPEVDRWLTSTVTIERDGAGVDAYYDHAATPVVVGTVKARLIQSRTKAFAGDVLGREANRVRYRLIVPEGTDLRDGDRVIVDGETFEVLGVVSKLTDSAYIETELAKAT